MTQNIHMDIQKKTNEKKPKEKIFYLKETPGYWDCIKCQKITDDTGVSILETTDYTECLDEVVADDTINAYDFIDAIKLGMQLAKEGYTSIKVINVGKEKIGNKNSVNCEDNINYER